MRARPRLPFDRTPMCSRARARACARAQMPDDLAYDPGVADLKATIKALQPGFVEAHKAAEAARSTAE